MPRRPRGSPPDLARAAVEVVAVRRELDLRDSAAMASEDELELATGLAEDPHRPRVRACCKGAVAPRVEGEAGDDPREAAALEGFALGGNRAALPSRAGAVKDPDRLAVARKDLATVPAERNGVRSRDLVHSVIGAVGATQGAGACIPKVDRVRPAGCEKTAGLGLERTEARVPSVVVDQLAVRYPEACGPRAFDALRCLQRITRKIKHAETPVIACGQSTAPVGRPFHTFDKIAVWTVVGNPLLGRPI